MPGQLYDPDTMARKAALAPLQLSTLAEEYRKNQTNFLTFEKQPAPAPVARKENFSASSGNRFGAMGKGEFDALYGLNAPAPVTYPASAAPRAEAMSGAVITKNGEQKCTPGFEMRDGRCQEVQTDTLCQPGWVKKGALCVKGPTEFMTVSNNDAPPRSAAAMRESGEYTQEERRKYLQEMETAAPAWQSTALPVIGGAAVLLAAVLLVRRARAD
jgi:hypothetical protein